MSTVSTTCGNSNVVGTGPVWPPPSPPCTITASTPHCATFSAWRLAPMEGITTTPASLSLAMSSCFGASANDATLTCSRISRSIRCVASGASARMFTPKGLVVRCFVSAIASRSWGKSMVPAARMPSPPAFDVAAARRGPATQPMPVWTIGYSTPTSSQNRVCNVGWVMTPPVWSRSTRTWQGNRLQSAPGSSLDLGVAQAVGVEDVADETELLVGGRAGLGDVVGDHEREAGVLDNLVDRDARVQRPQSHRVVRRLEVEHALVGDDAPDLVELRHGGGPGRGAVVAHTRHTVDLLDEHASRVVRHPVAGRMVDRVPGRAAHA